jgi:transcriptional regulator of met regulon
MKKNIEIPKLIVSPENYRFDPVDNQNEAIDLMLEEKGDEIINLAKHIYEKGLDKARDSRVLEIKKDLFLVLDGNRRATAIKCLENPSIVKSESLRNKFLKILKSPGSVPSEVNCFVYANEGEAAEWIKLDHTGKNAGVGQDPWEPAGKERFDYKFGGKVSPAMQILRLFQQETKKGIDTKALKISTVNRIISNPESRSYLGLDVRAGNVVLTSAKGEVLSRLDTLFNKIIVDDVAVKEVYHVPDSIKFMRDLFGDKPKVLPKMIAVSATGTTKNANALIRSLPKTSSRNTLIPKTCILRIHETKINNIYHELRELPLDGATNAVGVLFRVFLETNLDYYADKHGITFGPKIKLAGKIASVTSSLEKSKAATEKQLTNIRHVTNKGTSILSIDNFHEYVHSFKTQPVPVDLIYKWDNLQEFFEILWREIGKRHRPKKRIP